MRLLPFKFGTEIGGVDGPDGIDRIPAMLTKGETVLSKDESENLKEMGVFNVDRLVSGVKKMYNKDDEVDKFSFEMMKKFCFSSYFLNTSALENQIIKRLMIFSCFFHFFR